MTFASIALVILLLLEKKTPQNLKIQAQNNLLYTRIDTIRYTKEDSIKYALNLPIKSSLWDTLRDIKHDKEGVDGYIPFFTDKQRSLHQKTISIQGYMYPLEAGSKIQKWFMLSYYPSASCFFCGAAGPETVLEVKSPKGIYFENDKMVKIKGKIMLNNTERQRLFYIIEEAVLVKE